MSNKLSARAIEAMKSIANNPSWDILVDEYIIPQMETLNSVYDVKDLIDKGRPTEDLKADVYARIKAYGMIEMIVVSINKYRKDKKDNFIDPRDLME